MSDLPKPFAICGEQPVREPDKLMCAACFDRVYANWRKAREPAEE